MYPVRQPRHPAVGFSQLELLTAGPPDSPVVHRTVTIHLVFKRVLDINFEEGIPI
jgi:hypothetical protein